MVQQEHLDPKEMRASWAGAFGQLQMLPSTFLKSAVDGDGDGKRDLWHSIPDALASAASELASDGWQRGAGWGYEVRLPRDFPYELADGETLKPITEWTKLGVRAADGTPLPANAEPGSIYIPAGRRGPGFMTFANFKVILKYNNAVSYALAVCVLGDLIAGRAGIQGSWPRDEQPLSRDERIAFQTALAKLGFDPGKIDGVLGRGVKAALRQYQTRARHARRWLSDARPARTYPHRSRPKAALALVNTGIIRFRLCRTPPPAVRAKFVAFFWNKTFVRIRRCFDNGIVSRFFNPKIVCACIVIIPLFA